MPHTSNSLKKGWFWCLPLALFMYLVWRYAVARDVLIVNRYSQAITVRIAGVSCGVTTPAQSHRLAILPYHFSSDSLLVITYGADGKPLRTQSIDFDRKQNHYDNLLIIDVKP